MVDLSKLIAPGKPLPPLRRDLQLYQGPTEADGSPSYSLYDPVKAQYYKLGWKEGEMLRVFKPGMTPEQLAKKINQQTTLKVVEIDVINFFLYASKLNLLQVLKSVEDIEESSKVTKKNRLKLLLNFYLYYRIPLIYPDRFLEKTLPYVRPLGSKVAFALYAILTLIGVAILISRSEEYFSTFYYFFNWEGIFWYGLAISFVKLIHEFAHAYTAKRYGVFVPHMGVAFIIFWPVLYTDVTDSWKLWNRGQRIAISIAGVAAEIVLAGLATIGWALSSPGIWQSIFFIISSVTWVISLLFNLNPAMRFDGYYLLSDLWGIDNLQSRAFAIARWKLRQIFLGSKAPPPETGIVLKSVYTLLLYSLYTWTYRLFVMTAIALIVYYRFTKSLGLIMIFGVIYNYLISPFLSEMKEIRKLSLQFRRNIRLSVTLTVVALFLFWLIIPLPHRVRFPAITVPVLEQIVYAPYDGIVESIYVERGQLVTPGELLLRLNSNVLDSEVADKSLQVEMLKKELTISRVRQEVQQQVREKERAYDAMAAKLLALKEVKKQMDIRALISGKLFDWDILLYPKRPVSKNQVFGKIADVSQVRVKGFLPENLVGTVSVRQEASFILDSDLTEVSGEISVITPTRINYIEEFPMASIFQGPIASSWTFDRRLQVHDTYYSVYMNLDKPNERLRFGERGYIVVRGPWRSKLLHFLRIVTSRFWQESGF